MSSQILKRLSIVRPALSLSVRSSAGTRAAPIALRHYASDMKSTQGQTSPEHHNVRMSGSVNEDEGAIKSSRSLDGKHDTDTASLANPVSNPSGAMGQTEEATSTHEQALPDKDLPDEEKRKRVESLGQKPLDAADPVGKQ